MSNESFDKNRPSAGGQGKRGTSLEEHRRMLAEKHARQAAEARAAEEKAKQREAVVVVRSLRVRKDHSTSSEVVDGLVKDQVVTVLETWQDGDDVWAKLGDGRWAAMVYNGETLMKFKE